MVVSGLYDCLSCSGWSRSISFPAAGTSNRRLPHTLQSPLLASPVQKTTGKGCGRGGNHWSAAWNLIESSPKRVPRCQARYSTFCARVISAPRRPMTTSRHWLVMCTLWEETLMMWVSVPHKSWGMRLMRVVFTSESLPSPRTLLILSKRSSQLGSFVLASHTDIKWYLGEMWRA